MTRSAMFLLGALLLCTQSAVAQWDITGTLELELRTFPEHAAFSDQDNATLSPSIAFQPEFVFEWADGDNRLTFEPFIRWDAHDRRRTHFDMREGSYLHLAESWDIVVGLSRVFWGVTESVHLVDIINQTDATEDTDTEDKLGQPMLNLNVLRDSGTYSFFIMPGFRKRPFPGDDARRRGPFEIDSNRATFDSGAEELHVDYAFRWSQTFGDWDIAVSDFYGTSREPRLKPHLSISGISLRPHYDLIHQLGLEIQYTKEAWLWKFEAMSRWGHGGQFFAAVGGFEYTFYQIFESVADLGVLLEFQFDDRGSDAPFAVSDNDIFFGARLALNNESSTAILGGFAVDVDNGTTFSLFEAQHRLTNHWSLEIEARLFFFVDDDDPAFIFRRDDSVSLKMTYGF